MEGSWFILLFNTLWLTIRPHGFMVWCAEGRRIKSPVCTKELCAINVAIIVFLGGGGGAELSKVEKKFPTSFCNT